MATHTEHRKPTFDDVWLMFQETSKQFQETKEQLKASEKLLTEKFQETEKIIKLQSLETEQRIRDLSHHLDRVERVNAKRTKELDELFTGQWGKLVETLVEGSLVAMLKKRGIDIRKTYPNILDDEGNKEYDIIVANGKDVVVVEVKTTLKEKDVEYFVSKLKGFKKSFEQWQDKRILGAVVYLKVQQGATKNALKNGLFVIKATGSSASITNKPDFIPKAW